MLLKSNVFATSANGDVCGVNRKTDASTFLFGAFELSEVEYERQALVTIN